MSPASDPPIELSFGRAYERLQEVAAELSADATMPPERLIALLREGKGLERALRDHLDRVEQEVRAIDEGEGATPYRIADAASPGASSAEPGAASAALATARQPGAPESAVPASTAPAAPTSPAARTPAPDPAPAPARAPAPGPPAAPTLGFGADDDIPF